jgi:hypothetical protein
VGENSPTKVGGQFLRHQLRTEVRSVNGLFFHRTFMVDGFCDPVVSWQESAVNEIGAKLLPARKLRCRFCRARRKFCPTMVRCEPAFLNLARLKVHNGQEGNFTLPERP